MINIKIATEAHAETLALLGRVTYIESHGHFIGNENDLSEYVKTAFSVSKTRDDINDPNTIFYIISVDELPVGYVKLVLGTTHKSVSSENNCQLERIYILNDFIPLKLGHQLMDYIEEKVKEMQLNTIWLSVYIENKRAIRFYQKNGYQEVGISTFLVNGKGFENLVFSKQI
ncbi:GNAT family N-acetyltransferase [Winogradskyella sp. 3972H.M.0a.05]|uniref:GNAT family N-acetyltransferase n=1 Tax=Winogradskyella sp. 3972H.M.0a.05 TaxID=2950277 RepID=UPI00339902E7